MSHRSTRRIRSDADLERELETQLATIRDLVDWARGGFQHGFVASSEHGLYLLRRAELAVHTGRLQAWEHFLFLAALCQRTDVRLAGYLTDELCASAVRVELAENTPDEGVRLYRRTFERLAAAPDTAFLRSRVPARLRALKLRAAEEERTRRLSERRVHRARFETTVREIFADAMSHLPVLQTPPTLGLADAQLALAWTLGTDIHRAARAAPTVGYALERYGRDAAFRRNLAARAAERVALAMYGLLHPGHARDVAGSDDTDDWLTHDLVAAGRPIDVKNVRHWRRRGHPVEEARVAAFKTAWGGVPVTIAGMRSRMVEPRVYFHLLAQDRPPEVEFLGETDEAAFLALTQEFATGPLEMDFSRPGSEDELFLPHWLFAYPEGMYTGRPRALARITPDLFADRWFWNDARLHPLAAGLLAGLDVTGAPAAARLDAWQADFFRTLLGRGERLATLGRAGISLAELYLSVLEHFLELAGSATPPARFAPDGYREILFFSLLEPHRAWPAGVLDPTLTLWGLIDALTALWGKRTDLRGLRQFRLSGRGVLEGRPGAGAPWTTLVAYCGDCAYAPLVLGSHTSCPHCRKLVCPECNFCSPPPRDVQPARGDERSCRGGPRAAPRARG